MFDQVSATPKFDREFVVFGGPCGGAAARILPFEHWSSRLTSIINNNDNNSNNNNKYNNDNPKQPATKHLTC